MDHKRGDRLLVPDAIPYMSFVTTASGLRFFSPPTPARAHRALRLLKPDGQIADMAPLDFAPDYLTISVSPDGRYALLDKPDLRGTDLLIARGFR